MPISFECDRCRYAYQVSDGLAGKRGRCKQCGHVFTIPAGTGPAPDDLYGLDDERPAPPPVDEPLARVPAEKKQKAKRASGLPGLSSLPPVGVQIYRGVILAVLVASLVVGGVPKLAVALGGMLLCVGPFIAAGFTYRFGVAFRDGPIAGLLYMFFFPYRIHYRLTHQELFRKLRAPALKWQDYGFLVLALLFLPAVLLGAQELDKLPKARPAGPDWAHFGPKGPAGAVPGGPPGLAKLIPPLPKQAGPLQGIIRKPKAAPVEPPKAEPDAADPAPAEPQPEAAPPSRPAKARFGPDSARPGPGRPGLAGLLPPPGPGFRPGPGAGPNLQGPANPPARPGYGPEVTATITVEGPSDGPASKRYNDAIVAILKASGGGWSVGSSTIGGKVTFNVAPVADLRAFADKIDFGKVTRVEGRSIDVEAGP